MNIFNNTGKIYFVGMFCFIGIFLISFSSDKEVKHLPLVDHEFIDSLNLSSAKEFKLLYTYAPWCSPCRDALPLLNDLCNSSSTLFDLYVVVADTKTKELQNAVSSLEDYPYLQNNLYALSETYHKKSNKNYKIFVDKLVPNHDEFGLSLFVLFDGQNEVVYASTYNETKKKRIDTVKSHILD